MLRLGEEFAVGACEGQNCLAVCDSITTYLWPYGHQILGKSALSLWISMDDAMWKRHFQTIGFWGSPRGGWYSGRVAAALQGVSWHQIFCLLFSSKLIFKSSKMLCIHRVTEQEMGGFHLDSKVGPPRQLQKVVPRCVTAGRQTIPSDAKEVLDQMCSVCLHPFERRNWEMLEMLEGLQDAVGNSQPER